jgi:hypothetical protein
MKVSLIKSGRYAIPNHGFNGGLDHELKYLATEDSTLEKKVAFKKASSIKPLLFTLQVF